MVRIIYLIVPLVFILVVFFTYRENNKLEISQIEVEDKNIPESFSGFRIVHLSDLHNKFFGRRQECLIEKIRSLNPDLIVFTGDLVDKNYYNENAGLELLARAKKIAPTYFAVGNNDLWSGHWEELKGKINALDVDILTEESRELVRRGESVVLVGVNDLLSSPGGEEYPEEVVSEKLDQALAGVKEDTYKILIIHRPQYLDTFNHFGLNLVLAGHTHGGQIRLPFIGGLIAPEQLLFPKYSAGLYKKGSTTLIINRGLGNSFLPQRLFNRPEVGLIILQRKN